MPANACMRASSLVLSSSSAAPLSSFCLAHPRFCRSQRLATVAAVAAAAAAISSPNASPVTRGAGAAPELHRTRRTGPPRGAPFPPAFRVRGSLLAHALEKSCLESCVALESWVHCHAPFEKHVRSPPVTCSSSAGRALSSVNAPAPAPKSRTEPTIQPLVYTFVLTVYVFRRPALVVVCQPLSSPNT
jgi:hypothetical protein